MKYIREATVMYADTDSYQVVWHGAYLRWLEEGRYSLCKAIGIDIEKLEKEGTTFPIVDIRVRYKSPAKIFEAIEIETKIKEVNKRTITFEQIVRNKEKGQVHITGEVVCVSVSTKELKMAKLPEELYSKFNSAKE